jgi:hypothetical protein
MILGRAFVTERHACFTFPLPRHMLPVRRSRDRIAPDDFRQIDATHE